MSINRAIQTCFAKRIESRPYTAKHTNALQARNLKVPLTKPTMLSE